LSHSFLEFLPSLFDGPNQSFVPGGQIAHAFLEVFVSYHLLPLDVFQPTVRVGSQRRPARWFEPPQQNHRSTIEEDNG
jgi:hypothetical protein